MDREAIVGLLEARGEAQERLFRKAREVRREQYGDRAFLRAAVEISNYCRVNCDYCGMRRDNQWLERYRLTPEDIVVAAERALEKGINTLFIQGGEEPKTTDIATTAIPAVKKKGICKVIFCLGNKTKEEYRQLKNAGADAYVLKHETSDPALYSSLRHEHLEQRLECLEQLLELGYEVGTGTIVGLPGQRIEIIADDILLARHYGVHMISASPFIPNEATPLSIGPSAGKDLTLNTIATMRHVLPHTLIPTVSALEMLGESGQADGFHAGANVITVNMTPTEYRGLYQLYSRWRFIVGVGHAKTTAQMEVLEISDMPR